MPLGPTDPGYGQAWSRAWSHDVDELLEMFAPDAVYTDVAMGTSYRGRAEIARFDVPGVAVCTIADAGLVVEHEDFWDLGTVLAQASVPVG